MIYKAKHRYADVAPRKMRPLASMIRGMNVDEAMEALKFLPNRGARLIEAVVKSAVGNAEDQGVKNVEDLVVSECRIDGAPMFKRIRPRARGTAFGIKRRLAHIVVSVMDPEAVAAAEQTTPAVEAPVTPATPPASTPLPGGPTLPEAAPQTPPASETPATTPTA
jgi:large subunit ribosomal protein L22